MNKFIQKWDLKRKMGKKAYVLRYGVMYIGMTSTVIFSMSEFIFEGKILFAYLVARLIIFPTIGAILVGQRWDSREKKYHKMLNHS